MIFDAITLRKTKGAEPSCRQSEDWELAVGPHRHFWQVDVRYHKPADILALKKDIVGDFHAAVERIKSERRSLFSNPANHDHVGVCPVCAASSESATKEVEIYGATYVKCARCTHRFVINRLTQAALQEFYRSNTGYQSTYTDRERAQLRIEQIHKPKLEWLVDQFKQLYGRPPRAILDVGAGSGHFSACARDKGIACDGIELSDAGRAFAREVFGIELDACDFVEAVDAYRGRYDVVTFWGLIEHVPNPVDMLSAGLAATAPEGAPMVVASVPRWAAISSFSQRFYPSRIVRHLDPLGHIQVFTDTSTCAAVQRAGLQIRGAWYFGMDAYEMLLQLSAESSVQLMNPAFIDGLQKELDEAALADSMVFCAAPAVQ